jgi:hypothetical protein
MKSFDPAPHSLLLRKLIARELSGGSVNWFYSYLSNRKYQVSVSGILSSPTVALWHIPQTVSGIPDLRCIH